MSVAPVMTQVVTLLFINILSCIVAMPVLIPMMLRCRNGYVKIRIINVRIASQFHWDKSGCLGDFNMIVTVVTETFIQTNKDHKILFFCP